MTSSDSSNQHLSLWGGRFAGAPADALAALSVSTHFDWRLAHVDIAGSHAHADALYAAGLLSDEEITAMHEALNRLDEDVTSGAFVPAPQDEDVHTALERGLIERAGQTLGGKLRAGRSRNDQIATLIRMYLREEVRHIAKLVLDVVEAIIGQAKDAGEAVMPGRTHLQHAQPVLVAHHLLAHAWPLIRDVERFMDWDRRAAVSPYGSGALAGNTLGMDPGAVARALGFSDSVENSIDGTASRDVVAEAAFVLAMIGVDISRLCEEIIIWNTKEFDYVTLDDSFSTGSSIMPQKKNPDFAELTRGKTGRVYGDLVALLTTMKSLPLAYNKDLQECKEGPLDAAHTLLDCMACVRGMVSTWRLDEGRMEEESGKGFTAATDVADYLAKRGVPFRKAHEVVGELVLYCERHHKGLEDLTPEEFRQASELFGSDVTEDLDPRGIASARNSYGGTGTQALARQLEEARAALEADEGSLAGE